MSRMRPPRNHLPSRRPERRHHAEEQPGADRHAHRERQHRAVDPRLIQTGDSGGRERWQRPQHPAATAYQQCAGTIDALIAGDGVLLSINYELEEMYLTANLELGNAALGANRLVEANAESAPEGSPQGGAHHNSTVLTTRTAPTTFILLLSF